MSNILEAENAALRAELARLKADPIKWTAQQTQVENDNDTLRAELAAANDSIERSKDYESELRARIAELEGALEWMLRCVDWTPSPGDAVEIARATLERKL